MRRRSLGSWIVLWPLLLFLSRPAWSGEIVLPSQGLDRDARVQALYRAESSGTGKGQVTVTWTDVYDRLIERRKIPFELRSTSEVPFTLDLRRAVAMRNTLTVRLSAKGRREESAETSFIARPPDRPWWDYQIIMWQER